MECEEADSIDKTAISEIDALVFILTTMILHLTTTFIPVIFLHQNQSSKLHTMFHRSLT